MTLAADWTAAMRDALYRKYFGVSEDWLSSHGAGAVKALEWVEQMARSLVRMRLTNLHETATHEEQRA
jgi:hypothetical protein